eukprot:gnl/MRDRNA2_/MRDRNA2_82884_c0_seq3.p1 gnl/MRDRNA2_/MRDRNA2_82884_c0~~gnl/MRDRNA2_/MRDRNA2_82884_c0_seq3.p1  ORF type:complete len:310 (-),score=27.09 gnl/MRDRNA2_/MRDRNA2_82884_c0_seq3:3-932(-)
MSMRRSSSTPAFQRAGESSLKYSITQNRKTVNVSADGDKTTFSGPALARLPGMQHQTFASSGNLTTDILEIGPPNMGQYNKNKPVPGMTSMESFNRRRSPILSENTSLSFIKSPFASQMPSRCSTPVQSRTGTPRKGRMASPCASPQLSKDVWGLKSSSNRSRTASVVAEFGSPALGRMDSPAVSRIASPSQSPTGSPRSSKESLRSFRPVALGSSSTFKDRSLSRSPGTSHSPSPGESPRGCSNRLANKPVFSKLELSSALDRLAEKRAKASALKTALDSSKGGTKVSDASPMKGALQTMFLGAAVGA